MVLSLTNQKCLFELSIKVNFLGFGFIIDAIGSTHKFRPRASESAFTLIPDFLITGIITIFIGSFIIFWSVKFIDKKFGVRIFFFPLIQFCTILTGKIFETSEYTI